MSGYGYAEEFEAPKGKTYVRFDHHPKQDMEESDKAGRPIFKPVEYIEIAVPGDKSNIIHRPVRDSDRKQFATAYADWKAGNQQDGGEGTPLAEVAWLSKSQVEELKHFKVHTLENLAELSDGNVANIGPILSLRQKARDHIDQAKGNAPHLKARAEAEAAKSETEALRRQVKELGDRLDQALKAKK